jgi:hypothetical protein
VNAGQPDLKFLNGVKVEEEDLTTNPELKVRDH